MASVSPPRLGLALVRRLLPPHRRIEAEGDLIELWQLRRANGRRDLRLAFWRDAGSLIVHSRVAPSRTTRFNGGRDMLQDLRYTLRMIKRQPLFAGLVICTLTLGMAAAIAIFTVCDRVLMKPIPYPDPDRVLSVDDAGFDIVEGRIAVPVDIGSLHEFSSVGMWGSGGLNLGDEGTPLRVRAAGVSASFFPTMGVSPLRGRVFDPSDELANATVAVLGEDLWRGHFGADPGILGRAIRLNGRPFTILGVLPASATFPDDAEIWVPTYADRQIYGSAFKPRLVGRLAPGVRMDQASAAIARVSEDRRARESGSPAPNVTSLKDRLVGPVRPTLLFLAALVSVLLAATCANVASLVLARVRVRANEMMLRAALGASGARLARQVIVECIVFAGLGAVGGMALALGAMRTIAATVPEALLSGDVSIDIRLLVVCLVVVFVTALLFSLVPVLFSARAAVVLREGVTNTARLGWMRGTLVVIQIAAALVLLTGVSAAIGVVARLARVDLGFTNDQAAVFDLTLPRSRYADASSTSRVAGDLERAVAQLPSVTAVGLANLAPATTAIALGVPLTRADELPGSSRRADRVALIFDVTPGYFKALGIPLVAGRTFSADENRPSARVVMLAESAATLLWGSAQAAVGHQVRCPVTLHLPTAFKKGLLSGPSNDDVFEVVGVVRDVRLRGLTTNGSPQVYAPLAVAPPPGTIVLAVATSGDPATLFGPVQQQINGIDPDLPLYNRLLMRDLRGRFLAKQRLTLALAGAFGLVALALCAIAIYGVISQLVSQRTREIGIRLALGANPSRLQRGMVGSSLKLAAVGIAAGAGAAAGAARLIAGFVPDLDRPSLAAIALDAGLLVLVAVVAAWTPARRAAHVDPLQAVRGDVG